MNELMSFAVEYDAQIYTIGVFGNPGAQELLSSGRRSGRQVPRIRVELRVPEGTPALRIFARSGYYMPE